MLVITDLPCELIASFLRSLDSIDSLLPSLLTCRPFYMAFKQHPDIIPGIIKQQIPPALLPYSVTVLEASRLPHPLTEASIQELVGAVYDEPAKLVARVQTMAIPDLKEMGRTHDVIQTLVTDFATDAWAFLSPGNSDIVLLPTESYCFFRAFYRLELFFSLFRGWNQLNGSGAGNIENKLLLSKYKYVEKEQLMCAHDFLEKRLVQASRDFLAHDVVCGEFSINYLETGVTNGWMQGWISQGVRFAHRLIYDASYNTKETLLNFNWRRHEFEFLTALERTIETCDCGQTPESCSEEDIQSWVLNVNDNELNEGPYMAWKAAHRKEPHPAWVMLDDKAGLRERAYVLWHRKRIIDHNLLPVFQTKPKRSIGDYGDEEYEEMCQSWAERSRIWQKGGIGYWSKGDESRIEYSHRTPWACC